MNAKPLLLGIATYVPGVTAAYSRWKTRNTLSGTESASYCYDVWLKHLVFATRAGMSTLPKTVAELGPGSSLGVGLASLLCGVEKYYALDVLRYAHAERNLRVFDDLVALFRRKAPWREGKAPAWTDITGDLDAQGFPSRIVTDDVLESALAPDRLDRIRRAITELDRPSAADGPIHYVAPWDDEAVCEADSLDLVVSQSVLEHVVDLESTYRALGVWVREGGYMSHQIDFSSHSLTPEWNGHWGYSDFTWKMVLGRRPFLINRVPASKHVELIEGSGFEVKHLARREDTRRSLARSDLRAGWRDLSDEDFHCRGLLVNAQRMKEQV